MDIKEVCLNSYQKALDQVQLYLILTIATAVAVWLLRYPLSISEPITLEWAIVPVDASSARDLLLAFHIVSAAIAGYTLETAQRLASKLNADAELAKVVHEYPSIVCSPWPGVRLAIPIVSAVLILWTQLVREFDSSGVVRTLGIGLPITPHLVLIMYLWTHPSGEVMPIKSKAGLFD